MRSIVVPVGISLVLSLVVGCDRQGRERANQLREAELRALELTEFRDGMVKLVDGKLRLSKDALASAEKAALAVRQDIDAFAAASTSAMGEMDAKGGGGACLWRTVCCTCYGMHA